MLEQKIGLMFSGQGSQVTGLGHDFYQQFKEVKALYDQYPDIRDLSFYADEETISQSHNTQRILILFQIAITNLLKNIIKHDYAMGISLGEYGSLYSADVLSLKDTIEIIKKRADSMQRACQGFKLSSMAVLNNEFTWLEQNEGENSYYISNINSPTQRVITGTHLDDWAQKIKDANYKNVIALKVSGGFHSPFMDSAELELGQFFKDIEFKSPQLQIFYNYGSVDMDIKTRMAKQVSHTINVHDSLAKIVDASDILIEIGANKTLEKLAKKIDKSKEFFSIHKVDDFEKVRQRFGK